MTNWVHTHKNTVIARSMVQPLRTNDTVKPPHLDGEYDANCIEFDQSILNETVDESPPSDEEEIKPLDSEKDSAKVEEPVHEDAANQSEPPKDYDPGSLTNEEAAYFDTINARDTDLEEVPQIPVQKILAHKRKANNQLLFKVLWAEGKEDWISLKILKEDYPEMIARYAKSKNLFCIHGFCWCKDFLENINKVTFAL